MGIYGIVGIVGIVPGRRAQAQFEPFQQSTQESTGPGVRDALEVVELLELRLDGGPKRNINYYNPTGIHRIWSPRRLGIIGMIGIAP